MIRDATRYAHIDDPAGFGRVAVLMGGKSSEREISLMSGQAVLEALRNRRVDAHGVDAADDLVGALREGHYDRAFIALHGRGGEDGAVQGLLHYLGIPFTGSGVTGCAIAMDKLRSKELFTGFGGATPQYKLLRDARDFDAAVAELGLPMMVKPAAEGSSIGLTKVESADQLPDAWQAAARYECDVFAERWITGPEFSAAVLKDRVLPLVRIDAAGTFYDYEAKYFSDATRYICPCGLDRETEQAYAAAALSAFDAVGASGWGRVDFMVDASDRMLLLEVNTVPGMTSHSLVPIAAREAGMDFAELTWQILETSFAGQPGPAAKGGLADVD